MFCCGWFVCLVFVVCLGFLPLINPFLIPIAFPQNWLPCWDFLTYSYCSLLVFLSFGWLVPLADVTTLSPSALLWENSHYVCVVNLIPDLPTPGGQISDLLLCQCVVQPSTKLISSFPVNYHKPTASSYELCLAIACVRLFPFLLSLLLICLPDPHKQLVRSQSPWDP